MFKDNDGTFEIAVRGIFDYEKNPSSYYEVCEHIKPFDFPPATEAKHVNYFANTFAEIVKRCTEPLISKMIFEHNKKQL